MSAVRDMLVKTFANLFTTANGLAIGLVIVSLVEMHSVRADDSALAEPAAELQATEQIYRSSGPEAALPEFERKAAARFLM